MGELNVVYRCVISFPLFFLLVASINIVETVVRDVKLAMIDCGLVAFEEINFIIGYS